MMSLRTPPGIWLILAGAATASDEADASIAAAANAFIAKFIDCSLIPPRSPTNAQVGSSVPELCDDWNGIKRCMNGGKTVLRWATQSRREGNGCLALPRTTTRSHREPLDTRRARTKIIK
jgi:hypothetical protein